MAAFSSSYISNLVKIRHENHHALRLRLPLLPLPSTRRRRTTVSETHYSTVSIRAAAGNLASNWDTWKPDQGSKAPSLSDILWPSAGAFAAMAVLGKMDQMLARKGVSMTIAPLGAVCAVLFATPATPGARKYNMFMAQMGCAAIGVLAFSFFGPGWLARSTALSVSLAFMIYARAVHPPAASLPLLFIDGAKFHHLKFWYVLFPGAAGCLLLCLIQEVVCYLKENVKF
ncbi:transmembrane protein DDB_G0273707/DDB_G0273361-like [Cynara cardunculus var. scolymus]|uniref:transmembrane protein DDB_G0273707/DDB_G0273361-like n=1 Tax=Cynara cardunculus var. scolymus TaxID=59895 RepID=UPI000D63033B|nr:transmembrane protein DDB_G0273707/DDB_G0273361-like [Cynara cardunculus var. scolymus]